MLDVDFKTDSGLFIQKSIFTENLAVN